MIEEKYKFEYLSQDYEPEVFQAQFPIIKDFIYHLTYARVLNKYYRKYEVNNEFWVYTINAHMLQSNINWCMIFGAPKNNPIHWVKITQDKAIRDSFKNELKNYLGISRNKWELSVKNMINFRNKFATHREWDFNHAELNFEIPLKASFCYDIWIRKIIEPDIFEEPLLESSMIEIEKTVIPLADKLIMKKSE